MHNNMFGMNSKNNIIQLSRKMHLNIKYIITEVETCYIIIAYTFILF